MKQNIKRCCIDVIPSNAARYFKNPASILLHPSAKTALERFKNGSALEIGAGCLRNAFYLKELGYKVIVIESAGIEARFPQEYKKFIRKGGKVYFDIKKKNKTDFALATFVIETICVVEERINLLRYVFNNINQGGMLIISVRGPKDLKTAKIAGVPCSDGFLTPNKTFARSYTKKELQQLLLRIGFQKIEFLHKKQTKEPKYLHAIAWK